ncbi:unnamed protein product [Linum trigynum]|uniref:Transposase MuDR plant domain-containing protein n=1 Tax=Linum trigynum TaxID=586398 RepID=A0AAV2GEM8_9ROSI
MADSWEEGNGENVTNQQGEEDDFMSVEDGVAASVAKEVYHVYDSDDADTSDDEYHEARDNLRAYGETRKRRKVQSKRAADGEAEQLDEFEDVEVESGEEEEAENDNGEHGEDAGGEEPRNEASNHSISNHPPPVQEQAVGENSNDSFYRLSEDSDHVRPNLSDEEAREMYDDAPHYDPKCDHKIFQFVCRMKFESAEQFKEAVVRHSVAAGASLRWTRTNPNRREVKCKALNCKWKLYASWFR